MLWALVCRYPPQTLIERLTHQSGTWSLAGGHLEFDETFEQCAVRETKEETGLDIEDVRFLTALETFWDWQGKRYHYVTIFMTAFAKAGGDGAEPELKVSLAYFLSSFDSHLMQS